MSEWQQFFDAFATRYDAEPFTHNTDAEIAFLIEHLRPPAGGHILDVGCGTGRHSVALAQRGYRVTGVDLSAGMLRVAQERARTAAVNVEWVQSDATLFARPATFDAAICLCEGALGLLGTADDPFRHDQLILENIFRSLRPGGRFVLNVLNGCRYIRMYTDADVASGRFDIVGLTERSEVSELVPGMAAATALRERGYTPSEIHRLLAWVGFQVEGVYGGTAGDWGLRPPMLDEMELMAIGAKPA